LAVPGGQSTCLPSRAAGKAPHVEPPSTSGRVLAVVAASAGHALAGRAASRRRQPRVRIAALHSSAREAREAIRKCLRENRTVEVLRNLPDEALQELIDMMTRMELAPGEEIYRIGEEVTAMYVVESGELSVAKRLLQEDEEEFEATTLGPGSYIGELALFYNRPCRETVRVKGDRPATLWRLRRADFQGMIAALADTGEPDEEDGCAIDFENLLEQSTPTIFVVSDGTGYSGEGAVKLALKQFEYQHKDNCQGVSVTSFPFIRYAGEIQEITRRAREENALVVYTLMRPEPRAAMSAEVRREPFVGEGELRAVDLWEPMLAGMETMLGIPRQARVSVPLMRPSLSDSCLRMVEAIEYTQKLDDGNNTKLWGEADLVLIGLSRSGKTPLSFFLAQRGFKVANYPVVPDEDPPTDLFDPAIQHKCVGLTIKPERLQAVRAERMAGFGRAQSEYASLQNCTKEVNWLKTFYMRRGPRWPILDTTNGGVEETAAKILKLLAKQRGIVSESGQFSNPSFG